jgi:hypothetical protein
MELAEQRRMEKQDEEDESNEEDKSLQSSIKTMRVTLPAVDPRIYILIVVSIIFLVLGQIGHDFCERRRSDKAYENFLKHAEVSGGSKAKAKAKPRGLSFQSTASTAKDANKVPSTEQLMRPPIRKIRSSAVDASSKQISLEPALDVATMKEPLAQTEAIAFPSAEDLGGETPVCPEVLMDEKHINTMQCEQDEVSMGSKDQTVSAEDQFVSISRGKAGKKNRSNVNPKQVDSKHSGNSTISKKPESGDAPVQLKENCVATRPAAKEAAASKGPMVEMAVQTVAAFSAVWDIVCGDVVIGIGPFCVDSVQGYLDVRPGVRIVVQYIGNSSMEDERGYLYGTRLGSGAQAGPGWFPASVVVPIWECDVVRRIAKQSNDYLDLDCTICLDKRRNMLCLPCSHMPVCKGCWQAVSTLAGVARKVSRCPLCRTVVEQIHTVNW